MEPFKPRGRRPESIIQDRWIEYLKIRDWFVRPMHGNAMNYGWPDLYCTHSRYGQRWVEVKKPGLIGSAFTAAQKEWFPKMIANGSPIWILTWACDEQYKRLFGKCNYHKYTSSDMAQAHDTKWLGLAKCLK